MDGRACFGGVRTWEEMCANTPVSHIIYSGEGSEFQCRFRNRLGIRETGSEKLGEENYELEDSTSQIHEFSVSK